MDFSNWKPRSHYAGLLMTDGAGKSNLEKYNEYKTKWRMNTDLFEDMDEKKQALKTSIKLEQDGKKAYEEMKLLEPVKDVPNMGDTCKTKLNKIWVKETKGREEIIESKYIEKGLKVEEDSITLYSLFTGKFHKKNETTAENDWITGHMDIDEDEETVVDTKSSWDAITYYNTVFKPLPSINHWQVDAYMWLYNKKKAKVAYCLINTPEHLIRAEEIRMMYKLFGNEMNMKIAPDYMLEAYNEVCVEIRKNHTFDDIPMEERVHIFNVERSESRIDALKVRIEYCRNYLNNIGK